MHPTRYLTLVSAIQNELPRLQRLGDHRTSDAQGIDDTDRLCALMHGAALMLSRGDLLPAVALLGMARQQTDDTSVLWLCAKARGILATELQD